MSKLYLYLLITVSLLFAASCNDSTSPADNVMKLRKNVKNLTAAEKQDYVNAILKLKETPSPYNDTLSWYDQFVWWHREAFVCDDMNPQHQFNEYPAHMGPAFLPWHRAFLLEYEKALSQVSGKNIALPYWDWTDDASTAAVFSDDMMGGDGDANDNYALKTGPFRKGNWVLTIFDDLDDDPFQWTYIVRALGKNPPRVELPSKEHINEMMTIDRYDHPPYNINVNHLISFRNYLEGFRGSREVPCNNGTMDVTDDDWTDSTDADGIRSAMHNAVHLWVGGAFKVDTMIVMGTMTFNVSPNDPVFFLHHANVDRMWSIWMKKHGQIYEPVTGGPTNTNLNDHMPPYSLIGKTYTPAMMLDSRKNNFYYEVEEIK